MKSTFLSLIIQLAEDEAERTTLHAPLWKYIAHDQCQVITAFHIVKL